MKNGFKHHNIYTQNKPGEVAWLVLPRIVSSLFFLPIAGLTPPYLACHREFIRLSFGPGRFRQRPPSSGGRWILIHPVREWDTSVSKKKKKNTPKTMEP